MKPEHARAEPLTQAASTRRALELEVGREIEDALRTACSPLEVYRLALARVTPIVGASFASVFLRDDHEPRLFRLACAHNWPQSSARFLGDVRIREGRGPTGRALLSREAIEVSDVFGDPELEAWWQPAREIGFASMVSLPLAIGERVFGAVSFYFSGPHELDDDARALLGVVAHRLATAAERAHVTADVSPGDLSDRAGPAGGSR